MKASDFTDERIDDIRSGRTSLTEAEVDLQLKYLKAEEQSCK